MSSVFASLLHPSELYALAKIKLQSQVSRVGEDESESYRACYVFLNRTSRSFARVIQELDPCLKHAICLFYLVLRGLDVIYSS